MLANTTIFQFKVAIQFSFMTSLTASLFSIFFPFFTFYCEVKWLLNRVFERRYYLLSRSTTIHAEGPLFNTFKCVKCLHTNKNIAVRIYLGIFTLLKHLLFPSALHLRHQVFCWLNLNLWVLRICLNSHSVVLKISPICLMGAWSLCNTNSIKFLSNCVGFWTLSNFVYKFKFEWAVCSWWCSRFRTKSFFCFQGRISSIYKELNPRASYFGFPRQLWNITLLKIAFNCILCWHHK